MSKKKFFWWLITLATIAVLLRQKIENGQSEPGVQTHIETLHTGPEMIRGIHYDDPPPSEHQRRVQNKWYGGHSVDANSVGFGTLSSPGEYSIQIEYPPQKNQTIKPPRKHSGRACGSPGISFSVF